MTRGVALLAALAGCGGEGTWHVETWGEDYIEQEIPAEIFADGCSVQYDKFLVLHETRQLLDGDGEVVGELPAAQIFEMTHPGPIEMGDISVPADHYSEVLVRVAPAANATCGACEQADADLITAAGASVLVQGRLTCGADSVHFDWAFAESTDYTCEPTDLTIPAGGEDDTQLTIHGDHLFYDGLENADAVVRGQAIVDADTDDDGEVTLAELGAVSIPALGYEVGEYSDVLTLDAFVSHLSRTVVHIDGEGECRVNF